MSQTKIAKMLAAVEATRDAGYEKVGKEIRRCREAKRMTQEQLAEAVGLGRTSLNKIEQGRQRFLYHTLLEIAEALDCHVTDILS